MISQNLFDETLLENQDVFEYTDDEAVKETIDEFVQQQSQAPQHAQNRLEHLSLTHPSSPRGKTDRDLQRRFVESLEGAAANSQHQQSIEVATSILKELHPVPASGAQHSEANRRRLLSLWFLMLQNNLWTKLIGCFDAENGVSENTPLIDFVGSLLPDSSLSLHPLARDLKRAIAPFWFDPRKKDKNEEKDQGVGDADATTNTWYRLLEDSLAATGDDTAAVSVWLAQLARKLCNGCEDNKKSFVNGSLVRCCQRDDKSCLELMMGCLGTNGESNESSSSVSFALAQELCGLIAVLSKFQPNAEPNDSASTPENPTTGGTPLVSSAHSNVKEFHRTGAVPRLHRIAKECLQQLQQEEQLEDTTDGNWTSTLTSQQRQELLCESLSALRAMAIDNNIVQNMIALGILDTVRDGLAVVVQVATARDDSPSSPSLPALISTIGLATATLGLVRNLCANDEVKTTICKSSLPLILQVMQHYLNNDKSTAEASSSSQEVTTKPQTTRRTKSRAVLEEHACGILAAMALRQPQSAHAIVEEGGHVLIFQAMRAFPGKVPLQRQGCLAVRNIASRLSRMSSHEEDKTKLLDAGAEDVLQNIAGKHPASSEEAYAALRDLGCNPQMFQLDEYGNTTRAMTEAFGTVKSNFRPVYE